MGLSLRPLTCCGWILRALFLSSVLGPLHAVGFTFSHTSPTQCDPFTVNWTGGKPPFHLVMVAPNKRLVNFTIPSTAFKNNTGRFTMPQLMLGESDQALFTISDAVGLSSGGITSLLAVGPSQSNAHCTIISSIPDFFFSLDGDLEECKPYPFSSYPDAIQPITIFVFVPQGQAFALHPHISDTFTWTNNLAAGTSVTFSMVDSQGRSGGSSDMRVVQLSDNSSCISSSRIIGATTTITESNLAPISTGAPPPTGTTNGSPTVTTTITLGKSKTPKSITAIVGAVVGSVVLITLLATSLFLLQRRRQNSEREKSLGTIDLTASRSPPPFGNDFSSPDIIVPFNIEPDLLNGMMSSFVKSAPLRDTMSSVEGHNSTQCIVGHTDIAEIPLEELLELPPCYS